MIDIRELRIDSSVLCDGVRAKVVDLQTCHFGSKTIPHVRVKGISPETGEEKIVGGMADSDYMQPIPITEELLKELGFTTHEYTYDYSRLMDKFFDCSIRHIEGTNRWRLTIIDLDGINYGNILCRYLHELEAFVYLTTKQELI